MNFSSIQAPFFIPVFSQILIWQRNIKLTNSQKWLKHWFLLVTGTHEMSKTASPQVSRPLKSRAMGMISGVATNLKSRLSQFNSSGSSLSPGNQSSQHHQSDGSKVVSALHSPARSSTSSGSESAGPLAAASSSLSNHVIKRHSLGEQPASVIPLTVPGADSTMPSFPYGKLFYWFAGVAEGLKIWGSGRSGRSVIPHDFFSFPNFV